MIDKRIEILTKKNDIPKRKTQKKMSERKTKDQTNKRNQANQKKQQCIGRKKVWRRDKSNFQINIKEKTNKKKTES